ncbi:MAG TPA: nicotinate-nucleotide adenylyltransferase [Longilinea sp.]|nr:nicotinate-nucleotide adenylyltransferase [Longilinea sp.]
MRIGVFGGTFDPPHVGHLILAMEAVNQMHLDLVLWVLTPDPPHKSNWQITPVEKRQVMLEAAIVGDPQFVLSRVDIDRPAPHYAVDTIRLLKTQYPNDSLVYLIGGDSLHDFPAWHDPVGLVSELDSIGVLRRPADDVDMSALEKVIPGLTSKTSFINAPQIEISGRVIRRLVASQLNYRYYLPPAVFTLVQQFKLYSG